VQAPVVDCGAAGPLGSGRNGRTVVDGPGGVYFRMGRTGAGVTVGGLPERLGPDAPLDPYGPENPRHVAGDSFRQFAAAALARVLGRFRGTGKLWETNLRSEERRVGKEG